LLIAGELSKRKIEIKTTQVRTGESELDYLQLMNRVLPKDIRVLAWAPVDLTFDARFNCQSRVYKYYFFLGSLDVEKMKLAAQKFRGIHDFRNFCKMDLANGVFNFEREIYKFDISLCTDVQTFLRDFCGQSEIRNILDAVYEFIIHGSSFLWHQVRCMVAVLFLIGSGLEEPSVIDELLNVQKNPRKPVRSRTSF
jgi:tRNA pseudouridine38/39 synthase